MAGLKDPLGRGIRFPFQIGPDGGIGQQGSTTEQQQVEMIRQSYHQILGTEVGERLGNRGFGSRLYQMHHRDANIIYDPGTKFYVLDAIGRQDPRAQPLGTSVDVSKLAEGRIDMFVSYRIRKTNLSGTAVAEIPIEGPSVGNN